MPSKGCYLTGNVPQQEEWTIRRYPPFDGGVCQRAWIGMGNNVSAEFEGCLEFLWWN